MQPSIPITGTLSTPSMPTIITKDQADLERRVLPSPLEFNHKLKHKVNTRTTLARVLSTLPVALGGLSGIGLGVLSGLLMIGVMVTPVGWAILGGAAAFAVILGALEARSLGAGAVLLAIAGGVATGFGPFLMYNAKELSQVTSNSELHLWHGYHQELPTRDSGQFFFIGLGGFATTLLGLSGMAVSSIPGFPITRSRKGLSSYEIEFENDKLLNLASLDYGLPDNQEKYKELLDKYLDEREIRHLKVDDRGKLAFVSLSQFRLAKIRRNFRTYSGINQKVIELQLLKFLVHGVKKGWINNGLDSNQERCLLKRVGLSDADPVFEVFFKKIREIDAHPSSRERVIAELDMLSRAFFVNNVKGIVESQTSKNKISTFYFDKGTEALKSGNSADAVFYFGQGAHFNKTCAKELARCYLEGLGTPQDLDKAYEWYTVINNRKGLAQVAIAYVKKQELQKAYEIAKKLGHKEALIEVAKGFFAAGELEKAEKIFVSVNDRENIDKLAMVYLEQRQLTKAEKLILLTNDPTTLKKLADIYIERKKFAKASELYLKLQDKKSIFNMGLLLEQMGDPSGAVECYADICALHIHKKTNQSFFQNKATQEAVKYLQGLVEQDKRIYFANIALGVAHEYGIACIKDLKKALSYYKMAAANASDDEAQEIAEKSVKRLQ